MSLPSRGPEEVPPAAARTSSRRSTAASSWPTRAAASRSAGTRTRRSRTGSARSSATRRPRRRDLLGRRPERPAEHRLRAPEPAADRRQRRSRTRTCPTGRSGARRSATRSRCGARRSGSISCGNLIYAAANDQTVGSLAAIMLRAGAVRAMELDINTYWVSFITYRHPGALGAANLLPDMDRSTSALPEPGRPRLLRGLRQALRGTCERRSRSRARCSPAGAAATAPAALLAVGQRARPGERDRRPSGAAVRRRRADHHVRRLRAARSGCRTAGRAAHARRRSSATRPTAPAPASTSTGADRPGSVPADRVRPRVRGDAVAVPQAAARLGARRATSSPRRCSRSRTRTRPAARTSPT